MRSPREWPATWRLAAGCAVLLLGTTAAYMPAIRAGFIWDDDEYVTDNATLRDAAGLRRIWLEPGATPQYYPLVFTTFWAERRLWGLNPSGYHAVNVVLHAAASMLVWRLLRRWSVPGSFLAAAVFALHPVHVESVAWITERKNVLSGLFYLLSLNAWCRFRPLGGDATGSRAAWLLSLAAFAAALLSKTVTCSLPAAILLLTWWRRGRLNRRDVWPLIPMFVLGLAAAGVTVFLERQHVGAVGSEFDLTIIERTLIAGRAVWFYLWKLIYPAGLVFIYPRWAIDASQAWQYVFPAAVGAVCYLLWRWRDRIGRGPLTAWLYFIGTLTPALGFFNIWPMVFSFVADHFQYLASLGPIALASAVLALAARRLPAPAARAAPLGGALMLALLGTLSFRRSHDFRDAPTLWRSVLKADPDSPIANANLGFHLQQSGQTELAIEHYRRALRTAPLDVAAINNLLIACRQAGRMDDARVIYEQAVELAPDNEQAWFQLALAYDALGRPAEALDAYQRALAARPDMAAARVNLSALLLRMGDADAARSQLEQAIAVDPGLAEAHVQLAVVLRTLGRVDESLKCLDAAVRLRPTDAGLRMMFGDALRDARRAAQAVAQYRAGLHEHPDSVELLTRLSWLLATHPDDAIRDGAEAVRLARRAVELTRAQAPMQLDALAAALAENGDYGEAAKIAEQLALLARRSGNAALIEAVEGRLREYRAGRPARDPAQ